MDRSRWEDRVASTGEQEGSAVRPVRGAWLLDVCLGMLLPVFCLVGDPVVFHQRGFWAFNSLPEGCPDLRDYKLFVYGATALSLVALGLWLILARRPGWWSAVFCGALATAGLVSGAIGFAILPLTILGMMFLIGVLGLTPFAVCWLYLRDAARAFRSARTRLKPPAVVGLLLAGALAVAAPPATMQWRVNRAVSAAMDAVMSGRGDVDQAARRLASMHSCVGIDLRPLLDAYEDDDDASRRERIANAYRAITGEDIEEHVSVWRD